MSKRGSRKGNRTSGKKKRTVKKTGVKKAISPKKRIEGLRSVVKGYSYEDKVFKHFKRSGWQLEDKRKTYAGIGEIDLILRRDRGGLLFVETVYAMVECKNKAQVILRDFRSFVRKYRKFRSKWGPNTVGFFVYSGSLSTEVRDYYRNELDEELREEIKLKKVA